MNRIFPVRPDVRDERDFKYSALNLPDQRSFFHRMKATFTPEVVDLEKYCGPVKDQGQLGCCTGFTYSGYREFMLRRYFAYELDDREAMLSPLYVYYKERLLENTIYEDGGAQMRTGCQVLTKFGVCTEKSDPYNVGAYTVAPDPEDDTEAAKLRLSNFHRLQGVTEWKDCLRRGHPIAIGMAVYNPLFNVQADGMMAMPNPGDQMQGGHAVLVIGFDDAKKVFKIRNSWSATWGDHGNFYMPYAFADNEDYVWDAWMLTLNTEKNNG